MTVVVVVAVAVVAAVLVRQAGGGGGSDRAGANGSNGSITSTTVRATGQGVLFCPPPEAPKPTGPQPSCIPFDWEKRVAENHAFQQQQPISDAQRAASRPKADALAAELTRLAGTRTDETAVRRAVAKVLGLDLPRVEAQGTFDGPLKNISVGGGTGVVCVNGAIDTTGKATAEVDGRTNDGSCLPGPGGH
jgi:hypothetical protein